VLERAKQRKEKCHATRALSVLLWVVSRLGCGKTALAQPRPASLGKLALARCGSSTRIRLRRGRAVGGIAAPAVPQRHKMTGQYGTKTALLYSRGGRPTLYISRPYLTKIFQRRNSTGDSSTADTCRQVKSARMNEREKLREAEGMSRVL